MSYQVTLSQDELELIRLARLLNKQKVLEMLREMHSKGITVEKLLSIVKRESYETKEDLHDEALKFILRLISKKFPELEIPEKLRTYIPLS